MGFEISKFRGIKSIWSLRRNYRTSFLDLGFGKFVLEIKVVLMILVCVEGM